jgi:excinuclease ABC subunit C
VLYVGKAKNLKNRLNSYRLQTHLSPKIQAMLQRARFVSYQILRSELEAILVEAELINTYQPPYNVLLKDDKSPLYLVITKETFPRVLRYRRRDLLRLHLKGRVFGPFPSSYKVTEILKLIRPIFPWCNAPRRAHMRRCFENHLGLCAGVCTGSIDADTYQQLMRQLTLFLSGKTLTLTRQLTLAMHQAVRSENFEQAARIRDQLRLIREITSDTVKLKQDFFLPHLTAERSQAALLQLRQLLSQYLSLPRGYTLDRLEGYDVSNTSGQQAVVSMVVFTAGDADPGQYRSFNIRTVAGPNDFAMLAEALLRRCRHSEWPTPQLLVIDGGKGQVRSVITALQATPWAQIPIIGLAKDPDRLVIPIVTPPAAPAVTARLTINWHLVRPSDDDIALQLLQRLRDEAHRFGKNRHLKRRQQALFRSAPTKDNTSPQAAI